MAITAAIEANGWVLRLTVPGSLSSAIVAGFSLAVGNDTPTQWATNFSAYALAPNAATPAATLAITGSNGFVQSGGQAVASNAVARRLIVTKALRKATVSGNATGTRVPKNPDEIDNGDGTITVRLALSQHVYATDAGLTLTLAAGWRQGASAATVAVSNGSTIAAPAPIVRWADVPYQLQSSAFPLEIVVASHHPIGVAPVAAVKFTVTDGTTVKTYWATALSTSTRYPAMSGDSASALALRVYSVTVDPTVATALTKGLLRCDWTVYPWIGPAATSDVAGTRSMTNLGTAALATSAFVPFVVAWNPGNSWIVPRYAYVDPVAGATTAAAANTSTTATTAAATPLATINLAIESLRLASTTLAAANGQAAITQSVDGYRVRLVAGTNLGAGSTSVTFGVNTLATWLVVEGDPANANPRANCIVQSPASASGSSRVTRVHFANLTLLAQTNACLAVNAAWVDGIEVRGVAGQTNTTGNPVSPSGSFEWITATKWWQHGTAPALAGTVNPVLVRATTVERAINAPVVLNCARLPTGLTGNAGVTGAATTSPSSDPGAALERMVVACDFRFLNGAGAVFPAALANASIPTVAPYAPGSLALGKTYPLASRQAWLNNVAEEYGTTSVLFGGIGENNSVVASENIIEGNTYTGDRTNCWYNDLNLATVALNDSENCLIQVNRFANNVLMKCASKQDAFNDPSVASQRIGVALSATRNRAYAVGAEIVIAGSPANIYHCTTAGTTATTGGPTGTGSAISDGSVVWQWIATEARQHGYRPQATGGWPSHYGVNYEGNIDFLGVGDPTYDPEFIHEFFGIGSQRLVDSGLSVSATPYTLDKSGTTNRLAFQLAPDGSGGGNYRPLTTGAGTYILGRAVNGNVDADNRGVARVAPFAAGALEGLTLATLVPAADRQTSLASSPTARWAVTVAVAKAMLASSAAASRLTWAATLAAAATTMASRVTAGATGWTARLAAGAAAQATLATASTTAWATGLALMAGQLATHTSAGAVGWGATLASAGGHLASRVTTTVAGWLAALAGASAVSATRVAAGGVTWVGILDPDFARTPQSASAAIVTAAGPWLVLVDAGRIVIVDRTLATLLPGTTPPPERTLIVAGDFRLTLA